MSTDQSEPSLRPAPDTFQPEPCSDGASRSASGRKIDGFRTPCADCCVRRSPTDSVGDMIVPAACSRPRMCPNSCSTALIRSIPSADQPYPAAFVSREIVYPSAVPSVFPGRSAIRNATLFSQETSPGDAPVEAANRSTASERTGPRESYVSVATPVEFGAEVGDAVRADTVCGAANAGSSVRKLTSLNELVPFKVKIPKSPSTRRALYTKLVTAWPSSVTLTVVPRME